MKNCHRSERLDALIGKRVKVVFKNGIVETGVLGEDKYSDRYRLATRTCGVCFRKTYVRKVEEMW